jgi:transposase
VSLKTRSTFVLVHPSEIVAALVGLKDVRVLHYQRSGPDVELMIEQVLGEVRCPRCGRAAQVKDRPVVHYVDLPVYGTPMSLAWKKHRMRCPNARCAIKSWVLSDHRIAAKNCHLTTRAAKWATVQVGGGRTVSEVAAELDCDWHTVNEAVITYGEALLEADRKRLNQTSAIGLDETSFVRVGNKKITSYATTVADVEHHQIIDILPTRKYADVAGWIRARPASWKERIRFGALDMSATYAAVYSVTLPKADQVVDPFHLIALANRSLDGVRRRVQNEQTGHRGRKDDPLYRARRVLLRGEERLDEAGAARLASWPLPTGSKSACVTSMPPMTLRRPAPCSTSSTRTASNGPCHPRSKSSDGQSATGSTRSATSTSPG